MNRIPHTAAELNLPDAPYSDFQQSNHNLKQRLSQMGDARSQLSDNDLEREFFMRKTNQSVLQELSACADVCPFGESASIAPAASTGNRLIDALSGLVTTISPAVAAKIVPQSKVKVVQTPAPAAQKSTNWLPLALAAGGVVVLISLMATRK